MEVPVICQDQKRSTKDLFKAVLKKFHSKAKASREGRPYREDPEKVNKSFILGDPKKRSSKSWKRMEAPGRRPLL